MPRLNQTGPMGQGSMTGRGLGICGGGAKRGYGFGSRRFASPQNTLTSLENEEKMLEEELAAIKEEKAALKNQ